MGSLRWLRKLVRVAKEHDITGRACHSQCVGEGELPRFVDEQDVDRGRHVFTREEERSSADNVEASHQRIPDFL
jgi:hypothetical protein